MILRWETGIAPNHHGAGRSRGSVAQSPSFMLSHILSAGPVELVGPVLIADVLFWEIMYNCRKQA